MSTWPSPAPGPLKKSPINLRCHGAVDAFPLSGPPVRDEQLRVGGYRYILAGKYLVIYRLLGDTVVVYHIAHGATDYPKLFRTSYF